MITTRPRRSTSAVSYTDKEADELHSNLDKLRSILTTEDPTKDFESVQASLEGAQIIRQSISEQETPNRIRDAFRNLQGFETILQLLRRTTQTLRHHDVLTEDVPLHLHLVHNLLSLLSAALQDHWGNRKYFRKRVEDGGWDAVHQLFESLLEGRAVICDKIQGCRERIFGSLVACAMEDDSLSELFLKLGRETKEHKLGDSDGMATSEKIIRSSLGSRAFLHSPQIMPILLDLWILARNRENPPQDSTVLFVPTVIRLVSELSTHNLLSVHETGMLSKILPLLLDSSLHSYLVTEFQQLSIALLSLGVTNLEDARLLYSKASSSHLVAQSLRLALRESFSPPFIHFDLSLHGYASVELPDIGRTFPPPPSSAGYTLSVWLQIIHFDPESHTTIFGAFDSSQTCFVLVYLEKDTGNLILQTSVTSSRPSVRFKSFVFKESRWYHLCIVHRRPKTTSSSRASLFIDGEFVEQVKAHYPSNPPISSSSGTSDQVSRRQKPVQTFLGTPRDLATRLGPGVISSQWRLASAFLFNDALSDDLIAVHKELGPRYHGNYQDCLGSFQTYEASAALNLRNENLHPGKEEKSDIVAAIRSRASELLPESKFLLNISPMMVLDSNDNNNVNETQLTRALSKNAAQKLRDATRGGRTAITINGAIPSINSALLHSYGVAILTGDPAVVVPQSLDDAAWRIGGCGPIGLSLVDAAHSNDSILVSLEILFATVKGSWRNSEAMERENGFGVLSSLLSAKLSKFTGYQRANPLSVGTEDDSLQYEVLNMILNFVGYDSSKPENSVINNPLAYRILLVDLDIWRAASPRVQKLYYEQFSVFGVGSKYHHFNAKRLARMRIIKKWLEALKGDTFYSNTIEHFITAFQTLLGSSISAEALRSIALYVTYAIHEPKDKTPMGRSSKSVRRVPSKIGLITRRTTTPDLGLQPPASDLSRMLSRMEVGTRVLEMYAALICQQDIANTKKFARTVTNKWLLHLLADDDPKVIILATQILASVLIVNGSGYVDKFGGKTGGFIIMRYRLRRWWHLTDVWHLCFAILFGRDIAKIDLSRRFDLFGLMTSFPPLESKVVLPGMFPVIIAMLQNGLKNIIRGQTDPNSPLKDDSDGLKEKQASLGQQLHQARVRSTSVQTHGKATPAKDSQPSLLESVRTLQTVTRFLADMHSNSQSFRDSTANTAYVQELLFLLFPVVVSSDVVSPEVELNSRSSSLTFNGDDVVIRPLSQVSNISAPIVRTISVEGSSPNSSRTQPLKRGSSYVLITSAQSPYGPSSARLETVASLKEKPQISVNVSHALVENIVEIVIAVFSDQIFSRKDFQGIGLFMKVPPGFQEHQAYFESFVLRNTISSISNTIKLDQKLLWETRVLTNLGRFCSHLDEAVYEGWFIDGADVVLDLLGELLEYLQRPDIQQIKSVRLCSEIIASMRSVVSRITLLRMSEYDTSPDETKTVAFLNKLTYWQTILFPADSSRDEFLRLLCYLLYTKLISTHDAVREAAANLWRIFLVQKSDEAAGVLHRIVGSEDRKLSGGFQKILELDNDSFLSWVDDHRHGLDAIFFGKLITTWEYFVTAENKLTEEAYKSRISKRRERLKAWMKEDAIREDVIRRHEISSDQWRSNIYLSEHVKRQRTLQDTQDSLTFNLSSWSRMVEQLHRPCGLLDDHINPKWQLDLTEGRNRMRLRLVPDRHGHLHNYQAKGASAKSNKTSTLMLDMRTKVIKGDKQPIAPSPTAGEFKELATVKAQTPPDQELEFEDDFEMVEEPAEIGDFEDKNRKVMRSLQRGDQVEHVHNISKIIGLEASEGLLIVGKMSLYLLDQFFQRSDGEIVDAWQAPAEERDSYLQMISGKVAGTPSTKPAEVNHETRSWRWDDILSISKRRFLFRDVAIELFFVDGRSYLLTISTPKLRDELFSRLIARAPHAAGTSVSTNAEDQWRLESLRTPEDNPQTLGSRFTSVFAQGVTNPATRKWMKGEISNFHYLMLVNTMAGRTYNDLTQYPVFPWVLADFTSEELDLTNPRSFRDLTKPMGCQTAERQAEFRDRYQSFAEMGDHNSPPFHYGTHYSSAMIVTSFLIRLQPFVQSYLLLQGGSFDHPDRLFYSMEKTWASASRDNMTDVRELIPEFYYLPEMLTNTNGYDFGSRQSDGGRIDNVVLPPWAKGDPKIFIAKHREALESDYVSSHLHHWIDLVFGHKQQGEAAVEATNMFHHLSYRGARNLDEIDDPVERMATIGIIHNFGQTPHQVFQRSHAAREDPKQRVKKLDALAETLTRLPFPLLESPDRISTIIYCHKNEHLLCSGGFRINMPPTYDKYLEWGFVDGSVRFYMTDSNKLVGLFEHMHQGQLSAAMFADSRTLITAGTDCTISVWSVIPSAKTVDLQPRGCLFGHVSPVTTLSASRSFSALLSASPDGQVILWDLNRLKIVRTISVGKIVECARINDVTGSILLCHGSSVALYTLNGELLLEQQVCAEGDEIVTSCAFYEGSGSESLEKDLVFTGHKHGSANIWSLTIHDGRFMLEHVKRMVHVGTAGYALGAAITAILPLAHAVYTGDEDGRVYEWDCIQRQDR